MAQTIAMQRGTGSIAGGSSVTTTLFTQSGGTATRVIFNGLAWYSNSNASMAMSLYVSPSGGAPYLIGYWKQFAQSSQFVPSLNGPFGLVTGSATLPDTFQYYTGAAQYIALVGPDSVSSSTGPASVAQNFWIGPSDSVILRAGNSGTAQTFGYSFTTITES